MTKKRIRTAKEKETRLAYDRANKESILAGERARRKSKKDGLYTVYLLPKENYVGQTNNLAYRLIGHRGVGRDTTDAEVIGKYKTRREALDVEKEYHDKGYKGFNTGYANVGKKKGQQ